MAYLVNIYYQVPVKRYFEYKNITVYEDLYALSEMIQWIWRSRIRGDEDGHKEAIDLYIPSWRMRNLFKMWLDANSLEELLTEMYPNDPYIRSLFAESSCLVAAE